MPTARTIGRVRIHEKRSKEPGLAIYWQSLHYLQNKHFQTFFCQRESGTFGHFFVICGSFLHRCPKPSRVAFTSSAPPKRQCPNTQGTFKKGAFLLTRRGKLNAPQPPPPAPTIQQPNSDSYMIHICSGPQGGQEDNCCRLLTSWLAPSTNFKVCGPAWCLLFSSFDTFDMLTTIHWEGVGQKWFCVTSCIMIWQFEVYFTLLLRIDQKWRISSHSSTLLHIRSCKANCSTA